MWVACVLFVLRVPREALVPDLIVVGLVAAGALFLLGLLTFHREVLEVEPGEASVSGPEGPAVAGSPEPG